jgi:hypothetical protein
MMAVVNQKLLNVRTADAAREIRLVLKEYYEFALSLGNIHA